jgi:hypothetical protein
MKIIFYQASQTVPFTELYKPLGGYYKLFFSNGISELDKSQVRLLLDNPQIEDSIFLVPVAWEKEFCDMLHQKFSDIKWQEEHNPPKPSKEEIWTGWDEELGQFYEEVQVKWLLEIFFKPITEIIRTPKEEVIVSDLTKLTAYLNKAAGANDGISAVAVLNRKSGKTVAFSDEDGADGTVENLEKAIQEWNSPIAEIKDDVDKLNSLVRQIGNFQSVFLTGENGVLFSYYIDNGDIPYPCTVLYLNLKRTKAGAAETSAEIHTQKIEQLLIEAYKN